MLGWVVVLAACKPETAEPSEVQWTYDYAEAACAATVTNDCSCSFAIYGSQAECEDVILSGIRSARADARAAGDIFDADCAAEHIDALGNLGCRTEEELDADGDKPSCQLYFGDKALGEPCELFYWALTAHSGGWMSDCEQGLLCANTGRRCVTPEQPYVQLAEGEACADDDGVPLGRCPESHLCNATSKACVVPAALGEPCPDDLPCVDSWCDADTCVERKPIGEACESYLECESLLCNEEVCIERVESPAACFAFAL